MSAASVALATFILVSLCMGGLLLAVFLPQISGQRRIQRRRDMALGLIEQTAVQGGGSGDSGHSVRRSVEDALRDLEARNRTTKRGRPRLDLSKRLRQAGLGWTTRTFRGVGLGVGLAMLAVMNLGLGMGIWVSAGLAVALGLWLPSAYLGYLTKRRQFAFTAAFVDAVDIIVRGIRSGIPLADCLRIVASETPEPVRGEFRTLVEDMTMGLAVEEAVQRMADRVMLEEARFFAIVISIQTRTGGNLSETLGNLSVVLRDRAKMRRKIKAMSSEAKASAGIIGSLPPIVCLMVFLTSPDYVGLLFTTTLGNIVLGASALWMTCGILVMRAMINFDF